MQTIATKLFKNEPSQAVRIPKQFQFIGADSVVIRRQGNAVIISPKPKSWASLANVDQANSDFMLSRPELMLCAKRSGNRTICGSKNFVVQPGDANSRKRHTDRRPCFEPWRKFGDHQYQAFPEML